MYILCLNIFENVIYAAQESFTIIANVESSCAA